MNEANPETKLDKIITLLEEIQTDLKSVKAKSEIQLEPVKKPLVAATDPARNFPNSVVGR